MRISDWSSDVCSSDLDFNNGRIVYGIPDLEGAGFKIAFDTHGPVIDPDTLERQLTPPGIAEARAYVARRFPGLANAPLPGGPACPSENSPTGPEARGQGKKRA